MVEADWNMNSIVCNTDDEAMNSQFSRHVAKLYERKEEWVMACRSDIINRGHNTNNYAEATFRIVKDIILTRLKAYNSLALLDYVVVVLQKNYCGHLLNAAFGRLEKPYLLYQKIADQGDEIIQSHEDAMLLVDDEHYQVASGQLDGIEYDVYCEVGCCSCYSEQQGGFCKHLAAVHIIIWGVIPKQSTSGDSSHRRLVSQDRQQLL